MERQVVTRPARADDPCTSRFTHQSAEKGTNQQLTSLRSTPSRTASPWVVASRYVVLELLGRGGVGEVWLAKDTVLGRDVALKRLTGAPREPGVSALREAKVLAQLRHPGIVQIHDIVRDPIAGHPAQRDMEWIVMEALPSSGSGAGCHSSRCSPSAPS
jgi:serine/threonine protein kinase